MQAFFSKRGGGNEPARRIAARAEGYSAIPIENVNTRVESPR